MANAVVNNPEEKAGFVNWFNRQFEKYGMYIWTSIWILFVMFFGFIVIYCCTRCIDTNYSIIIIWAVAFFFLGALFGCIFGVPKGVSKPPIETPVVKTDPINDPNNLSRDSARQTKKDSVAKISYKGNTNLTDVSDWLTKIVIGAGLVQLNKIPGFILKVADRMATGIQLENIVNTQILCAGILIYYTCFGLISGYFVMRSILLDLINKTGSD